MWTVYSPGASPRALTVATRLPFRSVTCTNPLTPLPPIEISGTVRLSIVGAGGAAVATAAGGGAAADGVEEGVGLSEAVALAVRVAGLITGTGTESEWIPATEPQAVRMAATSAASAFRFTQLATCGRYAEMEGMYSSD